MKKKLNNKGFMMAELVIVSAIIIVVLVIYYSSFSKMYIVLKERTHYYNVDAVYILKSTYENMLKEKKFVNTVKSMNNYIDIFDTTTNCNLTKIETSFCNILKDDYNVQKILLIKYNNLKDINITNNDGLQAYLTYIQKFYGDTSSKTDYSYIYVIEFKNNNNSYYGNYLVK